jgi:hypothetical protein
LSEAKDRHPLLLCEVIPAAVAVAITRDDGAAMLGGNLSALLKKSDLFADLLISVPSRTLSRRNGCICMKQTACVQRQSRSEPQNCLLRRR